MARTTTLDEKKKTYLALLGQGWPSQDAAQEAGVTLSKALAWAQEPDFCESVLCAAKERLKLLVPRALSILAQQLEDGDDKIAQSAAKDVLSRVKFDIADNATPVSVVFPGLDAPPGKAQPRPKA